MNQKPAGVAAPVFAFRLDPEIWSRIVGALVAFCLISSAIYLLNDCLDVAADRAHPSKRSGAPCSSNH